MNPVRWFLRTRPTPPPPRRDLGDIHYAYCWGLNMTQWHNLTDFERAECRRLVTTAPNFQGATQ